MSKYLRFLVELRSDYGLEVHKIIGDGNCFYRTLAYYIYGDENMYKQIKFRLLQYIRSHDSHLRSVLGSSILESIINNIAVDGQYTNQPAIMDISCLTFNISLRVFKCNTQTG